MEFIDSVSDEEMAGGINMDATLDYIEARQLLLTPRLITLLVSREDACNDSGPGRLSPKAIWNGGLGYCLLGTSEQ